jgi:DNA-binding YbaB/EbfC family protein
MFGNNMMEKLQEMQKQAEESKQRLDKISVIGEAENGKVQIEITGNRKVKSIRVDATLVNDKEQLEDVLLVAMNRAIEQADKVNEAEMRSAAMNFMPNM